MLFCTGRGATDFIIVIASAHTFPLDSSLFLSSCTCLEEMKDHVESSGEPDSIPTDSIQSKGKGVEEALTPHTYLALISIYKQILISSRSCWIKIHFIRRILSAVQPSVTLPHPPRHRFFPCLSPSPRLCRGRWQAGSLYVLLQGQMHL